MSDSTHAGHRERIRRRYAEHGADSFADHELLELLLTYAILRKDTNALAHALLNRFGSLSGVLGAEINQLSLIEGIGPSVAVFLHLQGDLLQRISLSSLSDSHGRIALSNPLLAARYAVERMVGCGYETVVAVSLNSRKEVIFSDVLQRGSLTEAQVYPRTVAETALLRRAHSVVLIHNHPSGNPTPSNADREVTTAVRTALESLGIPLVDHMVVGGRFVYSFSADVLLDLSGEDATTLPLSDFPQHAGMERPPLRKVMEPYSI